MRILSLIIPIIILIFTAVLGFLLFGVLVLGVVGLFTKEYTHFKKVLKLLGIVFLAFLGVMLLWALANVFTHI